MLEFECRRCGCHLRFADGTIGLIKCPACEEFFLVPKDARVVPDDPKVRLPSYFGKPKVESHSEIYQKRHPWQWLEELKPLCFLMATALLLPFLFCLISTAIVAHDWEAESQIHRDTAIMSGLFGAVAGVLKDFGVPKDGYSFTQSLKAMLLGLPVVVLVLGGAVWEWWKGFRSRRKTKAQYDNITR